ncbi:hypothetical protein D4764_13G0005120 [Takifugu flavidus]|uniref:Uncharacterized protein n=1 Tax=Takifugu flavidus TaxID=433684 RepID=A0A5C6PC74_9TELE|nr:hypothetical protein D4764_13G0005120 [Takifugu flavidus]
MGRGRVHPLLKGGVEELNWRQLAGAPVGNYHLATYLRKEPAYQGHSVMVLRGVLCDMQITGTRSNISEQISVPLWTRLSLHLPDEGLKPLDRECLAGCDGEDVCVTAHESWQRKRPEI